MKKLQIDLGKGMVLEAPIKLHMTAEEWKRMAKTINDHL
jgi:hypothetical protein